MDRYSTKLLAAFFVTSFSLLAIWLFVPAAVAQTGDAVTENTEVEVKKPLLDSPNVEMALASTWDRQAYVLPHLSGSDCNNNGQHDACDVSSGSSLDENANGIPDECEQPADMDGDGVIGVIDLLLLLGDWGPCIGCPADFDFDDKVGVEDLLFLLANWG